jgi:hypothetical protein
MDSDDSDAPNAALSRAQKGKGRAIVSSDDESDSNPNNLPAQRPQSAQTNGKRIEFNAKSGAKGRAVISGLNGRSAQAEANSNGNENSVNVNGGPGGRGLGLGSGREEEREGLDVFAGDEEEDDLDVAGGPGDKGKKRKTGDVS